MVKLMYVTLYRSCGSRWISLPPETLVISMHIHMGIFSIVLHGKCMLHYVGHMEIDGFFLLQSFQVPTMAIEKVFIYNNTSIIQDEVI